MVIKLTDKGLVVSRYLLPGLARVIPYDEIVSLERRENGRGRELVIELAGSRPLTIGHRDADLEALEDSLGHVLDPPACRPGRTLDPAEFEQTMAELASARGARASSVLRFLLGQAERRRASDLHLLWAGGAYRAQLRVDGMLHDMAAVPEGIRDRLVAHLKSAAGLASYRRDVPQEGRISLPGGPGEAREIRLSIVPAHGGESVVIRLFDALKGSVELSDLGFSGQNLEAYARAISSPRGMVLVTGPTASGKTTTIYASLKWMMHGDRSGQRAMSLEDPIEYPLDCVSQVEARPEQGLDFDLLLSKALRQDAEIIVVGEIRDQATAGIALRAALTGHLIMSTVHCGSSFEAHRRLINLGAAPADVGEALTAVLAQRLVRLSCPHCSSWREIEQQERDRYRVPSALTRAREGSGCDQCLGSGYLGRTAVSEIMTPGRDLAELIAANAPVGELRQAALSRGATLLEDDAFSLVEQGRTTPAEVRRVI